MPAGSWSRRSGSRFFRASATCSPSCRCSTRPRSGSVRASRSASSRSEQRCRSAAPAASRSARGCSSNAARVRRASLSALPCCSCSRPRSTCVTLAVTGLALWLHVIPGRGDPLLSLLPGAVGVATFLAFLALPWISDHLVGDRQGGRIVAAIRIHGGRRAHDGEARCSRRTGGRLARSPICGWTSACSRSASPPSARCRPSRRWCSPTRSATSRTSCRFRAASACSTAASSACSRCTGSARRKPTAATVVYHAISLWVPAMWGTIAFVILRRRRHEPLVLRAPAPSAGATPELKAARRRVAARGPIVRTAGQWSQWMKLSYGGPAAISRSSEVIRGPTDAGPCGKRLGSRTTIPECRRFWLRYRRSSSRQSSRL